MRIPSVLCLGLLVAACVNKSANVENVDMQQAGENGTAEPQPSPTQVPAEVDPPPPVAPGEEGPGGAPPAPSDPPAETNPPPPARED